MALIKCSHCGGMISDKATKCPKCGNEIVPQTGNFEIKVPQTPKKIIAIDEEKLKKDNWGKMSIAITICLIVVMAFGVYENMFFHAGFGIYGLISLLVVCALLLCKGLSAIRYKTNGKSKLALYRLKSKWITILIWFLGISGIISLGIDVYQQKEYEKRWNAEECTRFSLFVNEAPTFDNLWVYLKWEGFSTICANAIKFPEGWMKKNWDETNDEAAISANLHSCNPKETQGSILRLSIVHGIYGDAILLGLNELHQKYFTMYNDYDEKIPVYIKIDDNSLKFMCPYTRSRVSSVDDSWYALLIYDEQYIPLLTELKSGKTCTVQIGDVDKIYKFNIEGLVWDEAIGNDVVAENEQEVVKMDSTAVSVSAGDDYERKTISDLKRMGLNGPVMELELWVEYFESETEYKQYQFDENGMLTKSQNELVGYPLNIGGEGVSSTCVYKDGKLVSSVVDADGVMSMFNYEYQKVSDTQTDVYRISTESDNREKAKSLYYDNEGNLIQKSFYYDMDNPFICKYNKDGVMSLAIEQNASEQITQKDEYGNWTEIVSEDCKTTRRISYY